MALDITFTKPPVTFTKISGSFAHALGFNIFL